MVVQSGAHMANDSCKLSLSPKFPWLVGSPTLRFVNKHRTQTARPQFVETNPPHALLASVRGATTVAATQKQIASMASNGKYGSHPYAPSAPSLPESYGQQHTQYPHGYGWPQQQHNSSSSSPQYSHGYGQPQHQPYGSSFSSSSSSSYGQSGFPAGTDPAVIRSFEMVDRDRSGYIDEHELQQALSSGYQRFSLRTIRLLIFLFKSPTDSLRVGPKEFAALWICLGQWRSIFERYDKDRSGKIDSMELRDALYGLGLAMPPSVLQLLISKYDDGSGRRVELNFDSFVECGMIVRGLTDRFKEKDRRYTGSATFGYDEFMSMVIPFLVSYN